MISTSKTNSINLKLWLEITIVAAITIAATFIKLWGLSDHAFVFDEAIHISIAKYFATNGYNWEQQVALGAQHMPLQYFIMGWSWLLTQKIHLNIPDELLFRFPSVLMSSLTIPVIYIMGKRWGLHIAIAATLLFAFHPYILIYTRFASLDFPALFWFTIGMLFYIKAQESSSSNHRHLWLSGVFFALAGMTKVYSLIILGPVLIHSVLMARAKPGKGWLHGAWRGIQVSLVTLAVFMGLSAILAKNPFQLYNGVMQILHAIDTLPSATFSGSIEPKSFAWDIVKGLRQVLNTMWTHLGWGVFLICLAGMFRLMDKNDKINHVGTFFLAFAITVIIVFAPFHFPRYLLVFGTAIPFLYAFGIEETLAHAKGFTRKGVDWKSRYWGLILLVVSVFSLLPYKQLSGMYSFQVVDDWTYGDGLKKAALFIKERIKPGEWVLTNSHYTVLKLYGGFPSDFYMGFDSALRVYTLYDWDAKRPVTYGISWQRERDMRYIVIDRTATNLKRVMFNAQMWFSFGAINPQLLNYMDSYTRKVASFPDENVEVYERVSRNLYSETPQPEIWVGEGGAEWKQSLSNHNGWILGEGWGQPRTINVNNEIHWIRPAIREGNRSADFILPVRDTNQPAMLEVTYLDEGIGRVAVDSLLDGVRVASRPSRSLSEIQLTNSGNIQKAYIPLPPPLYYDASPDITGYQQQFTFVTTQTPLPVIKLSLLQGTDDALENGLKQAASLLKSLSRHGDLVMTNSLHNSISLYTGLPTYFYMGFLPDLKVLKTTEDSASRSSTVLRGSQEKNLRYIIIDKRSALDISLKSYLDTYYNPVSTFNNEILQVFERKSRNVFSFSVQPELWVGEGGEALNPNFVNYNGWIFGEGWGQPRTIIVNNETYRVRSATREANRFADFLLPVRNTSKPATLEIMFQDVGTGNITVSTLLAEYKRGEQEMFLRSLGDIQLTNSGAIKTAIIPIRDIYIYDTSPDVSGHQQHFSFFTQGSPIQVIKVGIVQ